MGVVGEWGCMGVGVVWGLGLTSVWGLGLYGGWG